MKETGFLVTVLAPGKLHWMENPESLNLRADRP